MSFFAMLKQNAKRALQNNWGSAIVVQMIPFLLGLFTLFLSFLFSLNLPQAPAQIGVLFSADGQLQITDLNQFLYSIAPALIGSGVVAIFSFFVSGPVLLGITYWHTQLTHGRTESASKVFHYFESPKRYFRALGLNLQLAIRHFFWCFLFLFIPIFLFSFGIFYLEYATITNRMGAAILMGSVVLFLLFLGIALLLAAYLKKYFLATYKLAEDDVTPVRQLILASIEETKRFRFNLVWFELSFFLWVFLSGVFFPLIFYVGPYMNTSMAMYARYIMETKRRENPEIMPSPLGDSAPENSIY